jgi:uncharacterized protein (TIGR00299 family) protein
VPEADRSLHLDCFSGAAGNMILGALLDLGARARAVREALRGLGLADARMRVSKVRRGALAARYVSFSGRRRSARERTFRSIRRLIERSRLDPAVRSRALAVFERLALAEARVHGIEPEAVHFHEVGAIDSIGDIVGVCAALEDLGVGRITASPLPLGHGTVATQHGALPLPVPAALELLRGIPTYPYDVPWETVTPTGAALVATLAEEFGPLPPITPRGQGYGAGDDRKGPLPNLLRAVLGEATGTYERDVISVLETNLDDMNPEHLPFLIERLLQEGALDCSLTPLAMKKGRPGQLLRVLARPMDRDRLARRILLESTSIGVRYHDMPRLKLPRESRSVTTPYGRIRVKLVRAPGRPTVAPEYDACAAAARRHGVPLADVYRAAERAAEAALR